MRNFREKKRKNDEILEEKIMENQEKVVCGISSLEQKMDKIIKNQEKLKKEAERSNTLLNLISNNLVSLVQIGAHIAGVPVSEENAPVSEETE